MDLKVFYQKLKDAEAKLSEDYVVVVSEETADGGKAGVKTEVSRVMAARLIVEGKAREATKAEAEQFRKQNVEAKRLAEEQAAAARMQMRVISEADFRALGLGGRNSKA